MLTEVTTCPAWLIRRLPNKLILMSAVYLVYDDPRRSVNASRLVSVSMPQLSAGVHRNTAFRAPARTSKRPWPLQFAHTLEERIPHFQLEQAGEPGCRVKAHSSDNPNFRSDNPPWKCVAGPDSRDGGSSPWIAEPKRVSRS